MGAGQTLGAASPGSAVPVPGRRKVRPHCPRVPGGSGAHSQRKSSFLRASAAPLGAPKAVGVSPQPGGAWSSRDWPCRSPPAPRCGPCLGLALCPSAAEAGMSLCCVYGRENSEPQKPHVDSGVVPDTCQGPAGMGYVHTGFLLGTVGEGRGQGAKGHGAQGGRRAEHTPSLGTCRLGPAPVARGPPLSPTRSPCLSAPVPGQACHPHI